MGNFGQWISFGMLLNLNQRYNQGQNINKNELHTAIESCKYSHNRDVDNNNTLTTEQKEKRKQLFSKWQMRQKIISSNVCAMKIN